MTPGRALWEDTRRQSIARDRLFCGPTPLGAGDWCLGQRRLRQAAERAVWRGQAHQNAAYQHGRMFWTDGADAEARLNARMVRAAAIARPKPICQATRGTRHERRSVRGRDVLGHLLKKARPSWVAQRQARHFGRARGFEGGSRGIVPRPASLVGVTS